METKYKPHRFLGVVLLPICLAGLPAGNSRADEDSEYLKAVREFAGNAPKGLDSDPQGYVFPDVNQLPSHEGLPDVFGMPDGSGVGTKEDWYKQRDYLKAMLAYYQYGHMPPKPRKVTVQNRISTAIYSGRAIRTRFDLLISRKGKEVRVRTGILRPNRPGKFPVIVKNDEFLFDASEIESLSIRRIYEGKREQIEEFVRREAIKRGYIIFKFIRTDLALDEKDNRDTGVFLLYPEYDWGTIAAWAWGYQIVLDILERESFVDMRKVVATGHARGGKAALCAGIYDERIMITTPHVSGDGGTGSWRFFDPSQRPQGLAVSKMHGGGNYWVPRLFSFMGREDRLPFDAHFAKALIAPRVLLNTHARKDYGPNPYGTYLTHLAAQPVFNLLGVGENCLIHWRNGSDHNQNEEDWLALFDVCDKVFFGKETNRRFNDNPFPGLYRFDVLLDVNTGGITALHYAVEKGHPDLVELLIDRGANVNVTDLAGDTPLHYAARSRTAGKNIIVLLIANGADVNAKDNNGRTPLHSAARAGHRDVVEILLFKGADVNTGDNQGLTPLWYANAKGNNEIAELLRKHRAKE